MNYYFLLEDEKSFLKILPSWLQYIGFKSTRVPDIKSVEENNYILQSGRGVTQLVTRVMFDTIDTINNNPGKIDKLIIILDTEETTEESRKKDVIEKIKYRYDIDNLGFEILIFVCNHCFESWLLGKVGLYPQTNVDINSFFHPYYNHYNIETNDPEEMNVPNTCSETTAQYHFHYLHELFLYKKLRYSKSKPKAVENKQYFDDLQKRIETTEHLKSFKAFIDFLKNEST